MFAAVNLWQVMTHRQYVNGLRTTLHSNLYIGTLCVCVIDADVRMIRHITKHARTLTCTHTHVKLERVV